jgi:hypothetical protein
MFLNALHKTSFGEQKFQITLSQGSKKTDNKLYLGFHPHFG